MQSIITRRTMTFKYQKNDNGDFVCPDCGVIKRRQNSMHYHMKKHQEERNHVCTVCQKGFLQKQTLDLHIRSKHPELLEKETKKFQCPFENCTFSAMAKGNCIIHCYRVHFLEDMKLLMKPHADTKEITCTACDIKFQSSCSFYYHCKKCLPAEKTTILDHL